MSDILKPIVLADYLHDNGEMAWAWWHENHGQLAIIGDHEISPKKQMLHNIARLIHQRDRKCVFWITDEPNEGISELFPIDAIYWVEQYPDPPEEFVDRNIFISNRSFFSSAYLQLLAKKKGMARKELLPPSSYRTHLEGPFMGHIRSVERILDSSHKEWMRQQFNHLKSIQWYQTRNEGRKIYINNDSLIEQALSLLLAIWSFWAFTAKVDDPQQFLIIIEPPKELLMPNTDPLIQRIVCDALQIMKNLSEVTTTSIILATETLHPAPEQYYRYKLFFQTKNSDINLWKKDIQKNIQMPALYEAWKEGRGEAGMWEDSFTGERSFAYFRKENIEFWDDFKIEI